jgi:hypothetical protein
MIVYLELAIVLLPDFVRSVVRSSTKGLCGPLAGGIALLSEHRTYHITHPTGDAVEKVIGCAPLSPNSISISLILPAYPPFLSLHHLGPRM